LQKTKFISNITINRLMLFGEIIDRYFMNRTKQMYVDEILM